MRLTFRQGLARYQTDVYASPAYLQKSSQTGEFVDLIVSPDPTIVVFAHRGATYVVEENKTVPNAWGPFSQGSTRYLYWDLNLLDATLTRDTTHLPPIVAGVAPLNPATDQHWFDTTEHQLRVWNGHKWVDKLRVFAGTYSSQAVIQPQGLGTQAGEVGDFEGGSIVLDSFNKPLRQSDGTFVTSATELSISSAATKKVRFEAEILAGMADEFIPKFSFVQARPNARIILARSDDWRSRIVGLVTEDLYESEVGIVSTDGLVKNEQWAWPDAAVGRPVFCGTTGEITLLPPTEGVNQIAGYVYDKNSIQLKIQHVTILDDLRNEAFEETEQPEGRAPIADFHASPVVGTVPLTVVFTSTSLYEPTSYEWDFNNDGIFDAVGPAVEHTFTEPGSYDVKLRVSNGFGVDEELKAGFVLVNVAAKEGINTNLGIQLGGPLQIAATQQFSVSVTVSNDGYRTATKVVRKIIVDDMGTAAPNISNLPTGSKLTKIGKTSVIELPEIGSMISGQYVNSTFTITAPNATGTIKLRANVASPEIDSTLSDNAAELSVKVK